VIFGVEHVISVQYAKIIAYFTEIRHEMQAFVVLILNKISGLAKSPFYNWIIDCIGKTLHRNITRKPPQLERLLCLIGLLFTQQIFYRMGESQPLVFLNPGDCVPPLVTGPALHRISFLIPGQAWPFVIMAECQGFTLAVEPYQL
jgi:hypothetical protein